LLLKQTGLTLQRPLLPHSFAIAVILGEFQEDADIAFQIAGGRPFGRKNFGVAHTLRSKGWDRLTEKLVGAVGIEIASPQNKPGFVS